MQKEVYGYVYMIENIVNEKKYIGQTTNINKRMITHKSDAINGKDTHLYKAMRKYGFDNFVYYIIEEVFDKNELDGLEKYYIELFNTYKGYGYNMTIGGDGVGSGENHPMYGKTVWKNRKHTEETKEKMKKSHKGKIIKEETKQKMSYAKKGENNTFYGKNHTEETRKRISEHAKNRIGNKNPRAKSVVQLSRNDEFIAEYETITEASISTGCNHRHISSCCRGKLKTHGGFKWVYKNDYLIN